MEDEYTAQELADGVEVIEWAAAQPWCNGKVGMIGISWGGFNGLQVAALAPEALKAVVTVCSTDDRYADDIHYMGGCLLNDNLTWSSQMLAYSSRPPDRALLGEDWRETWLKRFARHASAGRQLAAAPTARQLLAACLGLRGLQCHQGSSLRRGWLGRRLFERRTPAFWPASSHRAWAWSVLGFISTRNIAIPEPAIGFLQECLRFWDHWLKGVETGIMEEPAYRAYMLGSLPPATDVENWPGRWIAEPAWPSPHVEERLFYLTEEGLADSKAEETRLELSSPFTTGANCGSFCPGMRLSHELPGDQREEDDGSLVFDSAPLEEPCEIFGAPVVELEVTSDRPVAQLVARLCDVQPDGASTRVTYRPLNLTHRGQPREALAAGARQDLPDPHSVERHRLCLPGGTPHSPGPFQRLLAHGLAGARAGDAGNPDRRCLPAFAGTTETGRAGTDLRRARRCPQATARDLAPGEGQSDDRTG